MRGSSHPCIRVVRSTCLKSGCLRCLDSLGKAGKEKPVLCDCRIMETCLLWGYFITREPKLEEKGGLSALDRLNRTPLSFCLSTKTQTRTFSIIVTDFQVFAFLVSRMLSLQRWGLSSSRTVRARSLSSVCSTLVLHLGESTLTH